MFEKSSYFLLTDVTLFFCLCLYFYFASRTDINFIIILVLLSILAEDGGEVLEPVPQRQELRLQVHRALPSIQHYDRGFFQLFSGIFNLENTYDYNSVLFSYYILIPMYIDHESSA